MRKKKSNKKRGRPTKNAKDKRTVHLHVPLTELEKAEIVAYAEKTD